MIVWEGKKGWQVSRGESLWVQRDEGRGAF